MNNKETTVNRNIDGETAEGHVHFKNVEDAAEVRTEVEDDDAEGHWRNVHVEDAETEGHIRQQ